MKRLINKNEMTKGFWIAWIVLIISLMTTFISWYIIRQNIIAQAEERFNFATLSLKNAIEQRAKEYQQVSSHAIGLFMASTHVSGKEWKQYVQSLNLRARYPALYDIGVIAWVPDEKKQTYLTTVQARDFHQYMITPSGSRPFYTPILYLEHLHNVKKNKNITIGTDLYASNAHTRNIIEKAKNSGKTAMTEHVLFNKEDSTSFPIVGFYTFTPVYLPDMNDASLAPEFFGFIYTSFTIQNFMQEILNNGYSYLDISLSDQNYSKKNNIIYSTGLCKILDFSPLFSKDLLLNVYDRTWFLKVDSLPEFENSIDYQKAHILMTSGILISFLLFGVMWVLINTRQRAYQLAHGMTITLQEREQQLRDLTNTIKEGIYALNQEGKITFVNPNAAKLLGWSMENMLGRNAHYLFQYQHEDGSVYLPEQSPILKVLLNAETCEQVEDFFCHKDGSIFPVSFSATPIFRKNEVIGVVVSFHDISQRLLMERDLRENEERLNLALHASEDYLWDWNVEKDIMYWSSNWWDFLGYTEGEEVLHTHEKWETLIHPDDRASVYNVIQQHFHGKLPHYQSEYRVRHGSGQYVWVFSRGKVVKRNMHGTVTRMTGIISDISQRKQNEEKLLLAESVFEHTLEGIFVTNLSNKIIRINPAFTQITGYRIEDTIGQDPKFLASGLHDAVFFNTMWDTLRENGSWQGEIWNIKKNGELFAALLKINVIHNENHEIINYIATFSDITLIKRMQEHLEGLANYDRLTKLPNRNLFYDRLSHAISRIERERAQLAILFVDLDNFKAVNDILGHNAGDEVLQRVSRGLLNSVRKSDTVCRLGGDEFVVLLEGIHPHSECDMIGIIERIMQATNLYIPTEETIIHVSASVGIAVYPHDGKDANTLLTHADEAMYISKRHGKHGYTFFRDKKFVDYGHFPAAEIISQQDEQQPLF